MAIIGSQAADGDDTPASCVNLLSQGLARVKITEGVHKFLELVKETLPEVSSDEYSLLQHNEPRTNKLEMAYPHDECIDLIDRVDKLTGSAMEHNAKCRQILMNDDEEILRLAMADRVLGRIYDSKEA